jgi:hypothetical protein
VTSSFGYLVSISSDSGEEAVSINSLNVIKTKEKKLRNQGLCLMQSAADRLEEISVRNRLLMTAEL